MQHTQTDRDREIEIQGQRQTEETERQRDKQRENNNKVTIGQRVRFSTNETTLECGILGSKEGVKKNEEGVKKNDARQFSTSHFYSGTHQVRTLECLWFPFPFRLHILRLISK